MGRRRGDRSGAARWWGVGEVGSSVGLHPVGLDAARARGRSGLAFWRIEVMGMMVDAFHPRSSAMSPGVTDDFWYTRDISGYIAATGPSGFALSADTILKCGTVLAAVRFRGDSVAMCPPSTFRKTAKGREEVPDHYSQRVLRSPNPWMTGNRWRHLMGVWMATWGNAYSEIKSRGRSFADELWPMHPSRVSIKDQRADGTLLYEYRRPGTEQVETIGQEKVLHFRGISTDGFSGL